MGCCPEEREQAPFSANIDTNCIPNLVCKVKEKPVIIFTVGVCDE